MLALAARLRASRERRPTAGRATASDFSPTSWSLSRRSLRAGQGGPPEHAGVKRLLEIFGSISCVFVRRSRCTPFSGREAHAALRILHVTRWRRAAPQLGEPRRALSRGAGGAARSSADRRRHLAYAVVRVTEGFVYNDAIIGGAAVVTVEPEVERRADRRRSCSTNVLEMSPFGRLEGVVRHRRREGEPMYAR